MPRRGDHHDGVTGTDARALDESVSGPARSDPDRAGAPRGSASVVSRTRASPSRRFGGRSATPCEVSVRHRSTVSPPAPTSSSSVDQSRAIFSANASLLGSLPSQDRRELGAVDVPARDDADDLPGARLAGERRRDRRGARALCDDVIPLGEQPHRGGDRVEAGDDGPRDQLPRQGEHLGEHGRRTDPVDEAARVLDLHRHSRGQRGRERAAVSTSHA